ncbi:MAG: ribose-5-phosphate isomerase RpiA [Candidatus Poseidoniaceae archaeon]|nr:ribose-5-phosphate isomerase RpiA [Candidatus Poseidoniaceae archaeon]
MSIDEAKRLAGIAACNEVKDGMTLGLGTGSTVHHTIVELARLHHEEGLDVVGVPTSLATHALATELGLPLAELDDVDALDVVIDGADEVDAAFQLIKGGGAALLREKLVAQSSGAMVVVADDRKMVDVLGAFPLPIEITPFALGTTRSAIANLLGCEATLRMDGDRPLVTDNGNHIIDAHTGPTLTDPAGVETALLSLAGVVQVGLFIDMCDVVYLAGASGAARLVRPGGRLA